MRFPSLSGLPLILTLILFAGSAQSSGGGARESWPGYIPIEPPVVVNLASENRARFVQIGIQLYVEKEEEAKAVKDNMPLIRDRIILFFGGRDEKEVREIATREVLRDQIKLELQRALKKQAGTPAIKDVYFTNFVIQ